MVCVFTENAPLQNHLRPLTKPRHVLPFNLEGPIGNRGADIPILKATGRDLAGNVHGRCPERDDETVLIDNPRDRGSEGFH